MAGSSDKDLGMGRQIARRDLLQGAVIGTGAALLGGLSPALAQAAAEQAAQDQPGYYPPTRLGMRGSHPGSFEAAHALRDGDFWSHVDGAGEDGGEAYDLVVVGGGISGLSAAHFWRRERPDARILVLDNHDDFGGHAKRNEFHVGGRTHLLNGGTWAIESPTPYSPVADGLLRTLGIDAEALAKSCNRPEIYKSLGLRSGIFFDRETFGADRLVVGIARRDMSGEGQSRAQVAALLGQAPLSEAVRRDMLRIETGDEDHLPGLTSAEKKDRLSRLSYKAFLLDVVKADPGIPVAQQSSAETASMPQPHQPSVRCW